MNATLTLVSVGLSRDANSKTRADNECERYQGVRMACTLASLMAEVPWPMN